MTDTQLAVAGATGWDTGPARYIVLARSQRLYPRAAIGRLTLSAVGAVGEVEASLGEGRSAAWSLAAA
jgi:hypothetical protein